MTSKQSFRSCLKVYLVFSKIFDLFWQIFNTVNGQGLNYKGKQIHHLSLDNQLIHNLARQRWRNSKQCLGKRQMLYANY